MRPRSATTDRRRRARAAGAKERAHKDAVRERDGRCRFPLCGCHRLNFSTHVAHHKHKGIGGNPTGDRSLPAGMILLCRVRHREGRVSIDQGTLRWRVLTAEGANGPVAWDVLEERARIGQAATWREVAVETAVGVWRPFTDTQAGILRRLASAMTC